MPEFIDKKKVLEFARAFMANPNDRNLKRALKQWLEREDLPGKILKTAMSQVRDAFSEYESAWVEKHYEPVALKTLEGLAERSFKIDKMILDAVSKGLREKTDWREVEKRLRLKNLIKEQHIETVVHTVKSGAQQAQSVATAQETGIEYFRYSGPIGGRFFCLQNRNKVYHIDDIRKLVNGQGLTVEFYCGGYNCRHRWVALTDTEAAKKEAAKVDPDENIHGVHWKQQIFTPGKDLNASYTALLAKTPLDPKQMPVLLKPFAFPTGEVKVDDYMVFTEHPTMRASIDSVKNATTPAEKDAAKRALAALLEDIIGACALTEADYKANLAQFRFSGETRDFYGVNAGSNGVQWTARHLPIKSPIYIETVDRENSGYELETKVIYISKSKSQAPEQAIHEIVHAVELQQKLQDLSTAYRNLRIPLGSAKEVKPNVHVYDSDFEEKYAGRTYEFALSRYGDRLAPTGTEILTKTMESFIKPKKLAELLLADEGHVNFALNALFLMHKKNYPLQ